DTAIECSTEFCLQFLLLISATCQRTRAGKDIERGGLIDEVRANTVAGELKLPTDDLPCEGDSAACQVELVGGIEVPDLIDVGGHIAGLRAAGAERRRGTRCQNAELACQGIKGRADGSRVLAHDLSASLS